MKNMKVRTKLNLILVLVILLVALGGTVSVKDMEDVKDKALETMEASSRQSYRRLMTHIKRELIRWMKQKKLQQMKSGRCVTERPVTSGLTSQMVQMWFCLAVIPREQTVWKPRMQKDTRW